MEAPLSLARGHRGAHPQFAARLWTAALPLAWRGRAPTRCGLGHPGEQSASYRPALGSLTWQTRGKTKAQPLMTAIGCLDHASHLAAAHFAAQNSTKGRGLSPVIG